jgi:hypothetical protein
LETEENRVLAMESVSDRERSWVLRSLEGSVSSLNPDATEGCTHNSATVLYLEYNHPNHSHDPRFNWDEQILVQQDRELPRDLGRSNAGCEESVHKTA